MSVFQMLKRRSWYATLCVEPSAKFLLGILKILALQALKCCVAPTYLSLEVCDTKVSGVLSESISPPRYGLIDVESHHVVFMSLHPRMFKADPALFLLPTLHFPGRARGLLPY